MSRNSKNQVEIVVDEFGNAQEFYPDAANGDYNRDEHDIAAEKEEKKEISRLNRHIVSELKSEIKTVIIALNRAVSLDELHEACEFFADTSVDVKLVKRAIRALVKDGKLTEVAKNNYELSQVKRDFYSALNALKKNPTTRLS
jgi:predicted HTH transcriptional regulator